MAQEHSFSYRFEILAAFRRFLLCVVPGVSDAGGSAERFQEVVEVFTWLVQRKFNGRQHGPLRLSLA